ncbi:ecto-ADP-ribosyltransferase 5-like [Carettochelys insculpta]|uniref:ecto-ADP-ribosyltransferase 5-like n=1 Tax=Carettochelys insculpta TaxID=44489 RepID=UPI003EB7E282
MRSSPVPISTDVPDGFSRSFPGDVGTMMKPLLIPLTVFYLQTCLEMPQAKRQVQLDLVLDAFDDQYLRCAEEMDDIAPALLEEEKSKSSRFSQVWKNSEIKWPSVKTGISLPAGFKDEYGIAIIAYTDNDFHSALNKAVRENGKSQARYMARFQFKAFHYYLTRALQLLRGSCDGMYKKTVYRGVSDTELQHLGSGHMRFGYFASSSFERAVAEKFGTETFFAIHTCFGVEIRNFSLSPEEEEVLIPVHELFRVFPGQGSNSFVLRSTNRTCSHFNCAYLGREKAEQCAYNSDSSCPGEGVARRSGHPQMEREQTKQPGGWSQEGHALHPGSRGARQEGDL